ncbi:hypothetical protein PPYR_02630 [Photinus pyralis]|uniref:Ig-like domain-containing protein n=2 Tax=Photinus pyralis TaxID=7054 RepID=A0A5N4B996_PHOPY|nr:hypothetical protein PPYR_02630 [Photinus pyralis]
MVLNEKGNKVTNYVLGPYIEGDVISLTCIATGGLPIPKVTWWQENALLDDSSENLSNNTVRNILHMEKLQRKHFHTILTCQASNNDFVAPISTSMRLDLNYKTSSIVAVQGNVAKLPCDITPSFSADKIHIVIWFKEDNEGRLMKPIYTFDSRDNSVLEQGKHWSDELILGDRAYFRFYEDPAKLTINNVLLKDEGFYNCRVDFKQSPTRNSRLNLTVIVPPSSVMVLNEKGNKVTNYVLGPYIEGDVISLTCIATGGLPIPKVTWWQENALLDDSSENLSNNTVRNILHMEKLQRKHFHTILTCQASNNDFVAPISTSMRLDLNLPPLTANLVGEEFPVSAGKLYQLQCEIVGSQPLVKITWWKGHVNVVDAHEKNSDDGNVTISTLTFMPTAEDEGKYVSCNAENPTIPNSALVSGRKLTVLHSPLLTLNLGKNLNNKIKEGSDIYFDCNIKANPWVYKISWKHNDKMLNSNTAKGVIINNQSLVLQNVRRDKTGSYLCVANNEEGEGESNSIHLEIEYSPTCRSKKPAIHEATLNETLEIKCELDASPKEFEFIWTFNNSAGFQQYLSLHRNASAVIYTIKSENDYGTLFCKGINPIGDQEEPCMINVLPRSKLDVLINCTISTESNQSLNVVCTHRLDPDRKHSFIAEVYEFGTDNLLRNLTSTKSSFIIYGLNPGLQIEIKIYIMTEAGSSKAIHLNAVIPRWENLAASPLNFSITPTLAITVSIVVVLVLLSIGLLAITRYRLCKRRKMETNYNEENSLKTKIDDNDVDGDTNTFTIKEEMNPDVVPLATNIKLPNSRSTFQQQPYKSYIHLKDVDDIQVERPLLHPQYINPHPKLVHYNANRMPPYIRAMHPRFAPAGTMPVVHEDQGYSMDAFRPLLTNRISRMPMVALPTQQLTATQL